MEWENQTVVFIGDSIVYGSGASDNAHRWTTLLCAAKGATEVNLGITGEVLQHGTTTHAMFSESTIPTRTPGSRYLFMALGLNDIALNNGTFTPAGYSAALDSFVTASVAKGWKPNQIVLVTPSYVTTYNAAIGTDGVTTAATTARHLDYISAMSNLATARGCVFADLYAEMASASSPSSLLDSTDGVHPNDTGHQFVSDFMGSVSYVPNENLNSSGVNMITATLSGSWNSFDGNASGQFGDVQFFKDDQNVVHMRGLCKNGNGSGTGSPGTVILVLPTGYRPKTISIFPVVSDNSLAGIEIIASNGEIRCRFNCSGQWISFHGVSFIAEG